MDLYTFSFRFDLTADDPNIDGTFLNKSNMLELYKENSTSNINGTKAIAIIYRCVNIDCIWL